MLMSCNDSGIALIKNFESCRLQSYEDQRGIPTIGFGSTGSDIHLGMVWNQSQCDERFADDLLVKAETPLNRLISPNVHLTSNQFSSLCSLCFNIGQGHFASSTVLSTTNSGNLDDVPNHILLWDETDGVPNKGLIRRRQAEIDLWNTPEVYL